MRLLFLDVETSPIQAYVWSLFNNHSISVDQVIVPTSILCWAAKWCGQPEIMFAKAQKPDSPEFARMMKKIHTLLSECDAVCHFNGNSFDLPRLNTEFLRLGMEPPPPCPSIDLLRVVQSKFSMTSNKLAFVSPYLKIGSKVKNAGWDLWKDCLAGDAVAWGKMEAYNKQDTFLLEKLYKKVLPWIDQHPNMNMLTDSGKPVCPNCGDAKLQSRGIYRTVTQEYTRYCCTACGRWSRARKASKRAAVEVR